MKLEKVVSLEEIDSFPEETKQYDAMISEIFCDKSGDYNELHNIKKMQKIGFNQVATPGMIMLFDLWNFQMTSFTAKFKKAVFTGRDVTINPHTDKNGNVKVLYSENGDLTLDVKLKNEPNIFKEKEASIMQELGFPFIQKNRQPGKLVALAQVSGFLYNLIESARDEFGYKNMFNIMNKCSDTTREKSLDIMDLFRKNPEYKAMYMSINADFFPKSESLTWDKLTYDFVPLKIRPNNEGNLIQANVNVYQGLIETEEKKTKKNPVLTAKVGLLYAPHEVLMNKLKKAYVR